MTALQPWLDGKYKVAWAGRVIFVATVKGEDVTLEGPTIQEDEVDKGADKRTWKHGLFGETDEKMQESTGRSQYVVKMENPSKPEDQFVGVVSDDGKLITAKEFQFNTTCTMEWIEDEEAQTLINAFNDEVDDYEAPQNHYILRPGHVGKLVWICGPPGSGKSTTARRMMETQGFVYYEGDCFFQKTNPYPPLSENSAIDEVIAAKALKGIPKEITAALENSEKEWMKALEGREDYDLSEVMGFMCENILKERKRVGGDWVVAHATPRKLRDVAREVIGPQLVFVVLDIDKDLQWERLEPRLEVLGETFNDILTKFICEPAADNEENTLGIKITRDMQLDDVVQVIMERIENEK